MEGTCPCGGRIKQSSHILTTDKTFDQYKIDDSWTLPVDVVISRCQACGRVHIVVEDSDGKRKVLP